MAVRTRASSPGWGEVREFWGGRRAIAALAVVVGVGLGLFARFEGGTTGEEEEAAAAPGETPNVVVAMHLDEPLPADRTVVWTAAFQAAWDALDDAVKREWGLPTLDLGLPAKSADVQGLRAGRLAPGTVNARDLTVVAGPATEETWAKVDAASDRDRPAGTLPPRAIDLVAFARLRASTRYEIPFEVRRRPILFGPSRTRVKGYGLQENAEGEPAEKMRAQAALHFTGREYGEDAAKESVVVLTGADGTRVVVSGRLPRATLADTWRDVADVIAGTPAGRFGHTDSLWIPRVSIVTGASFDALVGAPIVGMPPDARIAVAREDVMLTADEKGADVDAEAVLMAWGAMSKHVRFDGPFLLALLAKDAQHPYALAWMGSTDGLTPWGAPVGRPLTAAEARRLAGTWSLDREASVEETLSRQRAGILALPGGGSESSRLDRERRRLREWIGMFLHVLTVAPDGTANATGGTASAPHAYPPTSLARDGSRILLTLRVRPQERVSDDLDPTEYATEQRWIVSRGADRVTLDDPSMSVTLVFRRP